MPIILEHLSARFLNGELSNLKQALGAVGYVVLGVAGLTLAVWVYLWPYSEYFAMERNIPGECTSARDAHGKTSETAGGQADV